MAGLNMLILRHVQCGHAIGMANLIGRNLLETKRVSMALSGHSGWEIAEVGPGKASEAIAMPWPPCGSCFRHDLLGQPYLFMGGKPA